MIRELLEASLQEAVGSLWHVTDAQAAARILSSGVIRLSFVGSHSLQTGKKSKGFYLSCQRVPSGGYSKSNFGSSTNVRFELDWGRLATTYRIEPYDHWNGAAFSGDQHRPLLDEHEERIWSSSPEIPVGGYVKAIDVFSTDSSPEWVKSISDLAHRANIQTFWFTDIVAYRLCDRRKAESPAPSGHESPFPSTTQAIARQAARLGQVVRWLDNPETVPSPFSSYQHDLSEVLMSEFDNLSHYKSRESQLVLAELATVVKRKGIPLHDLIVEAQAKSAKH